MPVCVRVRDGSGATGGETGRCGRMGDRRRRLAAGQLAAGAEREREQGREGVARWGCRRDKSLETRLLKMQGDKRVKKPVIALKIRLQSITLDFTRPASNKRAVIYELSVKE